MTTLEIDEAKNLIGSMRDNLSLIAGSSADAEKLADLVLEKMPRMAGSYEQLARLLRPRNPLGNALVMEVWESFQRLGGGLVTIRAFAEVTKKRDPSYEEKLVTVVEQEMPRVISALDQIEQYLATLCPHSLSS